RLAVGLAAERLVVIQREVARIADFVGDRVVDRVLQALGFESDFGGGFALPVRVGVVLGVRSEGDKRQREEPAHLPPFSACSSACAGRGGLTPRLSSCSVMAARKS